MSLGFRVFARCSASESRDIALRSAVDLRLLVSDYLKEKKNEFSHSQVNYLFRAIYATAPTSQHANSVLELLPGDWIQQQQQKRKQQQQQHQNERP